MDTYIAPELPDEGEEIDPFGPDSGLAALAAFCEQAGLPLPPLPEAFIPLLEQVDETVFSSRDDRPSLVDVDEFVAEVIEGEDFPFVGMSHEGYGTNNWYVRYYCVLPGVALFIRIPYGGAYSDPDSDRAVIGAAFESAGTLIERALDYTGKAGYVIEYLGLGRGRWCVVGEDWQDDARAIDTVADKLVA